MANVINGLLRLTLADREAFAGRIARPVLSRVGARVGDVRLAAGVGDMLATAVT